MFLYRIYSVHRAIGEEIEREREEYRLIRTKVKSKREAIYEPRVSALAYITELRDVDCVNTTTPITKPN